MASNQQVASATQDNQPLYKSDWLYELYDTTILEQDAFRSFFSVTHQPAKDIVVIYEEGTNNPYGFGFVANEASFATGGIFRREADTATTLRNSLFRLTTELRKIHTTSQPQSDMGERPGRRYVNYIQFRIPSLLRDHQFSNYFSTSPASYRVVALFEGRPSGFGFLEISPDDSYMKYFKWMVDKLKMIICDGLATIPRSFLGQGVGSRVTYGVQQQQSGGRGRGSAATEVPEISRSFLDQGVIGSRMAHSIQQQQPMGERGRGSAATEVAQIPGRFFGQGVIGSRMAHSVQQQQRGERGRGSAASEVIINTSLNTFDFQPTDVMPHYAASNTPSSAPLWSEFHTTPSNVGSSAVTSQSLSGSFSGGQPLHAQWPGKGNFSGQSYAVMQQQQQQFSLHSQTTAEVFPYEPINRPFSDHMWSGTSAGVTHQVLSARPAGQLETNQWSTSTYGGGFSNTVMMQQQPGPSIPDITSGSSFGATDQSFSGSFAGGQPTNGEWSRAVGANRPVQNRDASGHPLSISTAGSSSVNSPEWNMWNSWIIYHGGQQKSTDDTNE